jgi:hypothetical protein
MDGEIVADVIIEQVPQLMRRPPMRAACHLRDLYFLDLKRPGASATPVQF